MDPLTQARHKSYKRMIARGLSHEEAAIKAGLIEGEMPEVVKPEVVAPVVSFEVPKSDRQEASKGKVLVEVVIYLDPDNPIELSYRTDMRGALLKTQQNRKFLSAKFSEFLRSFLGRVDDAT